MSKPTMFVPMTYEQFDELVINFGCPECNTHVFHHPKCGLGNTWEAMKPTEPADDALAGREDDGA